MSGNLQITRIKAVYNAFEELRNDVVFVGGAIVSLYANRDVIEPRPTDDIDVIVEVMSYKERAVLEEKLRHKGFVNDVGSGIICRYKIRGITVDIMPTVDATIGFNNRWYVEGFRTSVPYVFDDRHVIRILTAPYFIATKMEAFRDRGGGDGRFSHDFEDIVFVLEHRSGLWGELEMADLSVKEYLKEQFSELLSHLSIFEWIDSHVERASKRATTRIMDQIKSWISSC